MSTPTDTQRMEKIVSLCKRRGFIFQSSEIYGGTGSVWDYGPLGVELKRNLQERCGPWSGADMCAAFDAAHTPQARMGVRGSGPNQGHALGAPVAKLVFPIPSP